MKKILFLLLAFFSFQISKATHNRAGEISFRCLGGLNYEVTITTYTKTSSTNADRPQLDTVHWGDNSVPAIFIRDTFIDLPNDIRYNVYKRTHLYPGPGRFEIYFEDPNRNQGVVNVPNSVDVPFFVSTVLVINPFQGACNSSPILTYPPIDRGCKGTTFIHNPGAYDPDGTDSISYALTICRGAGGFPIPGYTLPIATNSFSIDPVSGDLIWDTPDSVGEYNVAFNIIEWRNGDTMSVTTRDMQINIDNCSNRPPIFTNVNDTCILAGDSLGFMICAKDTQANNVTLTASGGPLQLTDNPATFVGASGSDSVCGVFSWQTVCSHIRPQPYQVLFRAVDNGNPVSLTALQSVFIKVIGPAPVSPTATPSGNTIQLTWSAPSCASEVVRYKIYRRGGQFTGTIDCPCDNGVPSYTGFIFLDTTSSNVLNYTDDNNGSGLAVGVNYCYLIVAEYAGGALGCASPQVCAKLVKDLPVLTNVSVEVTDLSVGADSVAWSFPTALDTLQFPSPYQYRLYRATGFTGGTYTQVASLNNLTDTVFYDSGFNTDNTPNNYKLEFYYTLNGSLTLKGNSPTASSIFLTLTPTDDAIQLSWQENVPWDNYYYRIYRKDPSASLYTLIDSSLTTDYLDLNLTNGLSYCYYIESVGTYSSSDGFRDPLFNKSETECAVPLDNVAPCSPELSVFPDCFELSNLLTWNTPFEICGETDVYKYNIYFSPGNSNTYELIDSVVNANDTSYIHSDLVSIAGCYRLTAVDSVGNESVASQLCVDTCRQYALPNVFTPDGDGVNDLFHACDETTQEVFTEDCPPYKNVKSIAVKIFNRWGQLVYETTDPDVNWNGKESKSNKDCPEGVYYYTCKVLFYRLKGDSTYDLNGFVHLLRKK